MKESKLITLLRSFEKEEFKEFGNFLKSPVFVKNKKLSDYFRLLYPHYPEFNHISLNDEKIFEKLYPEKKFNNKYIKYLNTEIIKAAEMYLGYIEYRGNRFEQMISELRQLARKDLPLAFNKKASDIKELLNESEKRDSDFYLRSYLLRKEERNYNEIKKSLGKRAEYFEEIDSEVDEFVVFMTIVMLKYYVIQKNHKVHLNKDYKYNLLSELMSNAKDNLIDKYPVVRIFYLINQMFDNEENENIYYEAKDIAEKNYNILDKQDAELVYTSLFNYTRLKYINGKSEFGPENAALLKYIIIQNLYPRENGWMSQNTYLNAVLTGLWENDFSWVEEFINKYTESVTPAARSNVYNYSFGKLHYRKKEYPKSLEFFSKVKIEDFFYYIRVKNHLMKIYFETDDIDGLLVTIDSFRHFIGTHDEIPDIIKERFKTFINYLNSIITAKEKNDEFKLNSLKEKIKSSAAFENKTWLLEQLEAIKL